MRALAAAWLDPAIVQQAAVGRLPWGHVTVLLKLDDPADRDWYAGHAALSGWSRKVLEHHIATQLRSRAGAAANNFPTHLDLQDADQAREILRDPYIFDFLGLNQCSSRISSATWWSNSRSASSCPPTSGSCSST